MIGKEGESDEAVNVILPTFDEFLEDISTCTSISTAEQMRATIDSEILAKTEEIEHLHIEDIERINKLKLYIEKLKECRVKVEKRIGVIISNDTTTYSGRNLDFLGNKELMAHFMEFLQRSSRGHLLEFWNAGCTIRDFLDGPLVMGDEGITAVASNMLKLWHDFLKDDAPTKIDVDPNILAGMHHSITMYTQAENNLYIDEVGVNYMVLAMDEVYQEMYGRYFPAFQETAEYRAFCRNDANYIAPVSFQNKNSTVALSEDGSPRKRLSTLLMDTVFKKKKSRSINTIDSNGNDDSFADLQPPARFESGEDIQQEMSHMLNDDEAFVGRKQSTNTLGSKQGQAKLNVHRQQTFFEKSKSELRQLSAKASNLLSTNSLRPSTRKRSITTNELLPGPVIEETSGELLGSRNLQGSSSLSRLSDSKTELRKLPSANSIMPPLLFVPKRIFALGESINKLEGELAIVNSQLENTSQLSEAELRQAQYVKSGMWHELKDMILEKGRLEKQELDDIIAPVTYSNLGTCGNQYW